MTATYKPMQQPITLMGFTLEKVQAIALWLMFATSFAVKIEPAPCDVLFIAAFVLCLWHGLQVSVLVWPMVFYLLLYNIGGFVSFLGVPDTTTKGGIFVITTGYMSAAAMFLAFLVARDPVRIMGVIKNGWVFGAVMASAVALIGYANAGGLGAYLSPLGRAQGLFKDPNVLSTYLIPPALLLTQDFLLGHTRRHFISGAALLIIVAAWFLAFSRGAWVSLIGAAVLMIVLNFVLSPSAKLRNRMVLFAIFGFMALAVLFFILLSIPAVRALFLERFALVQYYDAGETGRFGNQINSIPNLLQRPLGYGPLQFSVYYGADPHNTFINSFSTYGWVGGISYMMLIISTIIAGAKAVLTRTPWQHYSIAIFCGLFTTILQGVQIDTDHWRHFYWSLGLVWGLFATSMMYRPPQRSGP